MRRRKQSEKNEVFHNSLDTSSPSTSFTTNWSTLGIIVTIIVATLFNGHMYMRHVADIPPLDVIRVGDFVDVRLPVLSGSRRSEDVVCSGRILTSNVSNFLILISGHALEGAQWMPRDRILPKITGSQSHSCSLSNSVVSSLSVSKKYQSSDRCSRFLHKFCQGEWEHHPKTRHFSSFECLYPSMSQGGDLSLSAWFIAQSIGKASGVCPDPSLSLWPPSKLTYPACSEAILKSSQENDRVLAAHFDFPHNQDALHRLQESAYSVGLCPPPDLFRWSPDSVLWPECDTCIRGKCAEGTPCHIDNVNKWASHSSQRSFADAQNWCAGRGRCPSSLEGRWRPGVLFYPNCSKEILSWCREHGVEKECMHSPQLDLVDRTRIPAHSKRVEAQQWAHMSCPDPISEFLWNWDLTE